MCLFCIINTELETKTLCLSPGLNKRITPEFLTHYSK